MISKVSQIMLYVNDQEKAKRFWTEKVGFQVISEESGHGMTWIEVAPSHTAQTSLVLHNRELVAQMSPELNLGTPSLMFFTENFDQLFTDLTSKNVTVGEIVHLPSGRVFNFADDEDNYFAVMEQN